ncbi:hypothetical protein CRYUN_Cryun34aG0092900 [Craigia yunnanensis]
MAWTLLLSPQLLTLPKFSVSTKRVPINSQRATRFVTRASATEKNNDKSKGEKGFTASLRLVSSLIILPAAAPFNSPNLPPRMAMSAKCSMVASKPTWDSCLPTRGSNTMSDAGFHCFAPDWIGFGFSDKPQPGYGFDYTEKEFYEELDKLLDVLEVKSPFFLVVQTWALKNLSNISKLAILNTPLTVSSPIPGLFQKLRIPLYGEFTSQNAVMAERFIEAVHYDDFNFSEIHTHGTKMSLSTRSSRNALWQNLFLFSIDEIATVFDRYVLQIEKADVYRLPYLASSGPGFALLEAARKINFRDISSQIADGFASGRWDKPVLIAWGIADKHLPQSVAEEFQKGNPNSVELKLIEGYHYSIEKKSNLLI